MKKKIYSTVYYDTTCGFCSEAKNSFEKKNLSKNLHFSSLTDPLFVSNLKKMSVQFQRDTIYFKDKDGRYYTGSEAIFKILLNSKGVLRSIGIIGQRPFVIKVTQPFYTLFAKNRYIISRLLKLKPEVL
jgi:predicted DCC family thiol-disulfide oxidoreductase YuxK